MPETLPKLDFNNTSIAYEAKSNQDLKRAKFLFGLLQNPVISGVGQAFIKTAVKLKLPVKPLIKATLYKQFIGGEKIEDCAKLADHLGKFGVASILDYAMEGEEDEEAFRKILDEFKRNIDLAAKQPNIPVSVFKPSAIARNSVLERLSAKKQEDWDKKDEEDKERIRNRFIEIFDHAYKNGVPVMVDAEESWMQAIIDQLVMELMKKYNKEKPIVINTYQLYRKDRLDFLKSNYKEAIDNGVYFGAKLVRGAYLEKERERASEKGYESPVHEKKEDTDRDFDEAARFCIEHADQTFVMVASHNENSSRKTAQWMQEKGLAPNHPHVWFSQLYGMADHITFNMAQAGYNVSKYIPYGPVKAVVPYLIRRAEENSSVQGQVKREVKAIKEELARRKNSRP